VTQATAQADADASSGAVVPAGDGAGVGPGVVPGGGALSGEASERESAERQVMERAIETPSARWSVMDRVEAFIARLSTRSNFWHRVCSMIWLPYAFRSGITMRRIDESTFQAVLPFKRFNRNWYNAMAGAALLANSEIAGGMYIFGITGGDYTLVCKELTYKFLRPCFGPAVYKITPREDLRGLIAAKQEFNITLELDVVQQALVPQAIAKMRKHDKLLARLAAKERRVGRVVATFHLTPVMHQKAKRGTTRNVG
jgi:acyl-coenzyme A thioesterase PaaI-like protein